MPKNLIRIILRLMCFYFASTVYADSPPIINTTELERQIHQLINWERQHYGLPALNSDEQLTGIARNHSHDMARHHFFNHINMRQETPSDRARRLGWEKQKQVGPNTVATGVAENIFLARLYDKIYTTQQNGIVVKREYEWTDPNRLVETIVEGWMNSPHHRKAMLSPQYDRQGIGVAISGVDVYITENLF